MSVIIATGKARIVGGYEEHVRFHVRVLLTVAIVASLCIAVVAVAGAARWILIAAVAVVASFFSGRKMAHRALQRELNLLDNAARRWRAGDDAARPELRAQSAFKRLNRTFGLMVDAVAKRDAARASVEDHLRRSRDAALQASLSKSQFLAAAGHDLRQPLQSMSMTVALLEIRHKADADTPVIARLGRAVSNLAELLNTLLDISQIEAGQVKPSLKTFAVAGVLNEIVEEYGAVAESKGIVLNVQSCDFVVRSDPSMLGRMIRNLVDNAIKFTPKGGIVDVLCRADSAHVLIVVRDSGIGMAEDKRAEIFRSFQQPGNPELDRTKGLGLGLAIVERMSRLLGHVLSVESTLGQGSGFSIGLPQAAALPDDLTHEVGDVEVQGRVLLVEDDELVLTTTAQVLEELGATVAKARSAEDALRRLGAESFDLIIADYRLPGSSGVELVRRAREGHPGIPAAVITGDQSVEELKRLVDFDTEVIQKPVRADRLARLFSKVTHA